MASLSTIPRLMVAGLVASHLVACAEMRGPLERSGEASDAAAANPTERACEAPQLAIFREAETDRAKNLEREIAKLQADLQTAEAALVEAESGLAANHTRADAVSSLAVTRIELERAASRAPWREDEVAGAVAKLDEAKRQIAEGRFGAALFFVYRARRVAESIVAEADQVMQSADAQRIRPDRVNLRAGPSTEDPVLAVLTVGTPVITQARDGDWMLVKVTGGPVGWVHRQLLEAMMGEGGDGGEDDAVGVPRSRRAQSGALPAAAAPVR